VVESGVIFGGTGGLPANQKPISGGLRCFSGRSTKTRSPVTQNPTLTRQTRECNPQPDSSMVDFRRSFPLPISLFCRWIFCENS
jgi:hypothetical protein